MTTDHFEARIAELHAADERNKVVETCAIALADAAGDRCFAGPDVPAARALRDKYRDKARVVLEAADYDQLTDHRNSYAKRCLDVETVLDRALGTDGESYTGEGIAADVAVVVRQRDESRAKLAELAHTHRRYTTYAGGNGTAVDYCNDHAGHNGWTPYPCATRLTVDGASAS